MIGMSSMTFGSSQPPVLVRPTLEDVAAFSMPGSASQTHPGSPRLGFCWQPGDKSSQQATRLKQTMMFDLPVITEAEVQELIKADLCGRLSAYHADRRCPERTSLGRSRIFCDHDEPWSSMVSRRVSSLNRGRLSCTGTAPPSSGMQVGPLTIPFAD
jgi:hypothetical protein